MNQNNNTFKLILKAKVIRSYDTISSRDKLKHKCYDIQLSIINKSYKPIYYWMMTCSWEENFLINNDYMEFQGHDCDSNFPKIFRLNQNDSVVGKTSILRYDYTRGQLIDNTRLGFIYIDSIKCKNHFDYRGIIDDKSQWDKIIWSNPLYLNERE